MNDQAALFNVIRLKIRTFRAFAIARYITDMKAEEPERARITMDVRQSA
jgi:hypothetical protein